MPLIYNTHIELVYRNDCAHMVWHWMMMVVVVLWLRSRFISLVCCFGGGKTFFFCVANSIRFVVNRTFEQKVVKFKL